MNQHKLLFLSGTVLFFFLSTYALAVGKHALLIGIQDYSYHPAFPSLRGPANDLNITRQALQARFGFQEQDFLILQDAQATHTNIEQAFKSLRARVGTGDFVYIYYSGHGSQTPDLNGDERDGQDQTWVSYGARKDESTHPDNYDILDDEIHAWLSDLAAKTDQIVFVSDSCHSATVSRGEAVVSRALELDPRPHPFGTQPYIRPPASSGIRIGAARDYESAIEFPPEEDAFYGLFTWFWVRALQQARDGETWNDVFKRAYTQVTAGRGNVQRPQLEGMRGLQLSGDFTPLTPTVPVLAVKDNLVTIQAGILSGATVGSTYRLYNPGHVHSQNLPSLTITEINTFVSSGQAQGAFKKGDLVVEERHAYHFPPLQVYLDADYPDTVDQPLLHALRVIFDPDTDTVPRLPAYTLTTSPQEADIHLYILHPQQKNGQYLYASDDILPTSFPEQPPEIWVLSPEHRLLSENLRIRCDTADPQRGLRILQENLKKLARIRELKTLQPAGVNSTNVTIDVYHLRSDPSCLGVSDCLTLPNNLGTFQKSPTLSFHSLAGQIFPPGDILTFTLQNNSSHGYYCYLLDIAPDGAVNAIFPAPEAGAEEALLPAQTERDLTNEVGLLTDLHGEETLKLIVSRQPIDISLLEQREFLRRGGLKGDFNPLEQLLINAVHGQRKVVRYRNDDWDTAQVSFEVKDCE